MRLAALNNIFEKEDFKRMKCHLIDQGITIDEIADVLLNFGDITLSNRKDALITTFGEFLNVQSQSSYTYSTYLSIL